MSGMRLMDRRPTSEGATIVFDKGRTVVQCTIVDFNGDGAGLEVPGAPDLPDLFDLHLDATDKTYPVRLCWRAGDRVGIRF
jgi:hypothetical protein